MVYFILNRWSYNALAAGEHTAVSLGVNVGRTRVINILACSFVAATVVSYIGLISFIGLCAPHIVRRLVGSNYTWLIPGSAFMGAVLMLGGDLVARTVISPVILPIGAITSFLGAPMFLYHHICAIGSKLTMMQSRSHSFFINQRTALLQ